MINGIPSAPEIYHIVHIDRLRSIIDDGFLWSDSETLNRRSTGSQIGMSKIKNRRLNELTLSNSHPDLYIGQCVPFYFCPRSVMLYMLHRGNHPEITYTEGQDPIIHLVGDLKKTVSWAAQSNYRWAFTLKNAGSRDFEDRSNLDHLGEINWKAVQSNNWGRNNMSPDIRDGKQAEFLIENRFPWKLVNKVGVNTRQTQQKVVSALDTAEHQPQVNIEKTWYY